MKYCFFFAFTSFIISNVNSQNEKTANTNYKKPNIIIFYIDDMGYSQPSCYGGKLVETPNIDKLAHNGIRFTNGYVSSPICGPSRVGLMTGRYQARTGHDTNKNKPGGELDLNEVTIAQRLKKLGYVTGIVGKWHLGHSKLKYLPLQRGFDYFYGHAGNVNEDPHLYYRGNDTYKLFTHPITSEIWANRALKFIHSNKVNKTVKPFFLYLAFNAVHTPIVAKEETLKKLSYIKDEQERAYAGLILEADEAIGRIVDRLKKLKIENNTLIYCISDNGGAYKNAEMKGLRGRKWYLFEGGIRVPFIMQWKGKIPPGVVSNVPVIQLDVMPTSINAAGGLVNKKWELDGVDLLPLATGKEKKLNRNALYWRFGSQFAIRKGNWKLVKALKTQEKPILINLKKDIGETTDLSLKHPNKYNKLLAMWNNWNKKMEPPRWYDYRWNRDEGSKPTPEK